jgi:hypothetical protein
MGALRNAEEYLTHKGPQTHAERVCAIVCAAYSDGYRLAMARALNWLREKEYDAEAQVLEEVLLERCPPEA